MGCYNLMWIIFSILKNLKIGTIFLAVVRVDDRININTFQPLKIGAMFLTLPLGALVIRVSHSWPPRPISVYTH